MLNVFPLLVYVNIIYGIPPRPLARYQASKSFDGRRWHKIGQSILMIIYVVRSTFQNPEQCSVVIPL